MKVYIVFAGYDYEGDDVIGVYDSSEKAARRKEEKENDQYFSGYVVVLEYPVE